MSTAAKAAPMKAAAVTTAAVALKAAAKAATKIQPLEDRVVILPAQEAETMRGPLYIPDTAKETPTQGEVLAVGPGRIEQGQRVKIDVAVGDTVIYDTDNGTPYQAGTDALIIVKASDVLAKIG